MDLHNEKNLHDDVDILNEAVLDFENDVEALTVRLRCPIPESLPISMKKMDVKNSYILPPKERGLGLILNVVEYLHDFANKNRRNGSEKDVKYLDDLLADTVDSLDYKLFPNKEQRAKKKITSQDFKDLIQEFKKECEKSKPASVIVFIGSHGKHPNQILTSDNKWLDLYKDIIQEFSHADCPQLKGTPKIFIVQACQSFVEGNETDNLSSKSIPNAAPVFTPVHSEELANRKTRDCLEHPGPEEGTALKAFPEGRCENDNNLKAPWIEDTLICTAVMPGQPAMRDRYKGSCFIYCLTYMMMKHALMMVSFQDILKMVETMIGQIKVGIGGIEQVPTPIPIKFKDLYFSGTEFLKKANVKNYCRMPTGLQKFLFGSTKLCIVRTLNNQMTCDKIQDNMSSLKPCYFLHWEEFSRDLQLFSDNSHDKNAVSVIKDCNLDNLTTLIAAEVEFKGEGKITFVTSCDEDEDELRNVVTAWKSKVEICQDLMEWNDLSDEFKLKVLKRLENKFNVKLKVDGEALVSLINGSEVKLFKETLPDQLSYHVERTLLTRNVISGDIFENDLNSQNILLISGIERCKLSSFVNRGGANCKTTGSSTEYLCHDSKAQFMVLDDPNHFDKICNKTPGTVHWLQYETNKLRWVKGRGDMSVIQQYVGSSQAQDKLTEECFCQSLNSDYGRAVCIPESPGMGKSVLLGQIGRRLRKLYPDRTVIFIVLSEFIHRLNEIRSNDPQLDLKVIIERALQATVCLNVVGEAVLRSMLNSDQVSIELLLDGLDEVGSVDLSLAYEVLKTIKTSFISTRVWVTSRKHMLTELESNLNLLGYNIQPFSEDDQVEFLTSFWRQEEELNEERVVEYAKSCLKSLKIRMNTQDHDIAGVPLQCFLIGEAYNEEAKEYSRKGNTSSIYTQIDINSVTQLYEKVFENKTAKYRSTYGMSTSPTQVDKCKDTIIKKWLRRLGVRKSLRKQGSLLKEKLSEDKLRDMHAQLGLAFIFPEQFKKLEPSFEPLDMEEILNVGIWEFANTGNARFIHRTFAEYYVALFLVDRLRRGGFCWEGDLIEFFLKDVLKPTYNFHLGIVGFVHPVITYFVNALIPDLPERDRATITKPKSEVLANSQSTMLEIARACACADFAKIMKWFDGMMAFEEHSKSIFNRRLLILAIDHSSLEMVKLVFTHFDGHHQFSPDLQIEALCSAVQRGKFSIVEFLIESKGLRSLLKNLNEGRDLSAILHDCAKYTWNKAEAEIDEKVQVTGMLVEINRKLLEVKNYQGDTPLLVRRHAHVRLLTEFMRLGANAFARDRYGDTVLHFVDWIEGSCSHQRRRLSMANHTPRDNLSGNDYHNLLTNISRESPQTLQKLLHAKGSNEETVLLRMVKHIDPMLETLDIFKKAGADFSTVDKSGDSVLVHAIRSRRKAETLRNLIKHGADVNWKGKGGDTCLHIAMAYGNAVAVTILVEENGLNANAEDLEGHTPLNRAINCNKYPYGNMTQCFEVLSKHGGRFKCDSKGQSMLHLAALEQDWTAVQLLLHFGLAVNGVNNEGKILLFIALFWELH